MKRKYKLIAALSALLITVSCFPVFTVKADTLTDETVSTPSPEAVLLPSPEPAETTQESTSSPEPVPSLSPTEIMQENILIQESVSSPLPTEAAQENTSSPEIASSPSSDVNVPQEQNGAEENADMSIPENPPVFQAKIEYNFQGYVVMGTFTEFPSDTSLVEPVYSLDGEIWEECGLEWNLQWLGSEDESLISKLQTQICLYPSFEPLKSYLSETLDCFYVKLRITRENGVTYDSQAALIERKNEPCPIPEEAALHAVFSSEMRVTERNPYHVYGQYQITVNEKISSEDITGLLPAALPIEIQIEKPQQDISKGTVNCPVTWKTISLPELRAGESVTIPDAAEEIIIPEGTLVNTPTGTFELHAPLPLDDGMAVTDEVRLVLNVISEDKNITGGLSADQQGLELFFDLKPTGASNIRTYTLLEGATEWTELTNSSIEDAINSHLSSPGGYYALMLRNDQEPYRSYLAAINAGETATPFLVGLVIEGGVYDKCQLILPWPGTYEGPLRMPSIGAGSGGNENNAGAGNKKDSTAEGQRPNLPKNSAASSETTPAANTLTEMETSHENQQNPAKEYEPDKTAASTPAAPEVQTAVNFNAEKTYPVSEPSLSRTSGAQANAAMSTLSPKQNASAVSVSSSEKEKTDSPEGISHKAVLPLLLISIAGSVCIAAFGKLAAGRIPGKSGK